MLELCRHLGLGMVTAFIRIEGHPLGVVANNPTHLAGALHGQEAALYRHVVRRHEVEREAGEKNPLATFI